jgi:hypothetical protein
MLIITGMKLKANSKVLYPPLRGIVQLSHSATLRFGMGVSLTNLLTRKRNEHGRSIKI